MLLKKILKSLLQNNIRLQSIRNNGSRILFPHLNKTLVSVIERAAQNHNCKVYFLPQLGRQEWDHWHIYPVTEYKYQINDYKNFMIDKEIDYFVIDRLDRSNLNYLSALTAANSISKIKTVYLEHGHTGSYHPNVILGWLTNFDYIYCQDISMKKYLLEEKEKYKSDNKIHIWNETNFWGENTPLKYIIYAPTFMLHPDRFERLAPATFRHKIQKEILSVLAEYDNVLYSYYTRGGEQINPIPNWIRKYHPNIKINEKHDIQKYFNKCRLFITDAISTPLYKAIEKGIISKCFLYKDEAKPRDDIKQIFKDSLVIFNDIKEIPELIKSNIFDISCKSDKFPWEKGYVID